MMAPRVTGAGPCCPSRSATGHHGCLRHGRHAGLGLADLRHPTRVREPMGGFADVSSARLHPRSGHVRSAARLDTSCFMRNANALCNSLEYPIWLLSGMLVPITAVLPGWTGPLAAILPHHLGRAGPCTPPSPAVPCGHPSEWCLGISLVCFVAGALTHDVCRTAGARHRDARAGFRGLIFFFFFFGMSTAPSVGGVIAYRALFNWATPTHVRLHAAGRARCANCSSSPTSAGSWVWRTTPSTWSATPCSRRRRCAWGFGGSMAVLNERRFGTLGHVLLSPPQPGRDLDRPRAALCR